MKVNVSRLQLLYWFWQINDRAGIMMGIVVVCSIFLYGAVALRWFVLLTRGIYLLGPRAITRMPNISLLLGAMEHLKSLLMIHFFIRAVFAFSRLVRAMLF